MAQFATDVQLVECYCGVAVALSGGMYDRYQEEAEIIYCPHGHTFSLKTNRLREERSRRWKLEGELGQAQRRETRLKRKIKKLQEEKE